MVLDRYHYTGATGETSLSANHISKYLLRNNIMCGVLEGGVLTSVISSIAGLFELVDLFCFKVLKYKFSDRIDSKTFYKNEILLLYKVGNWDTRKSIFKRYKF